MPAKILAFPGRYVQGNGVIKTIGEKVKPLGNRAMAICGKTAMSILLDTLKNFEEKGIFIVFEQLKGECCLEEINRIKEQAEKMKANLIIGAGGGKAIDTAKAVAYYLKLPVVIVPTVASTDAPCSALAVIHTREGAVSDLMILPKNPDLILVDTGIIARAPVRLFVSGMGDALATWFEADYSARAYAKNILGGNSTEAALHLARLCYRILLDCGRRAKLAVEKGVVTEDVEKVVEANILLSGLGFESGGLGAAHAIHDGLEEALEETRSFFHGEKVAFATLVQLVLENRSNEELEEVLKFCLSVGLPVTLRQIGLTREAAPEKIKRAAELACTAGKTIHNASFQVTPEKVYSAILAADAIGNDHLVN
ncbi:MAG: glycerol dehydrogenase [Firmicutes bacterium]|jgi:glycerol dehydrogenase|nr:glycerol dehydrogenase [Bacillota bacterium]